MKNLKIRRLVVLLAVFGLVATAGNLMEFGGRDQIYSDNYPAVVCPDIGGQTQLQVSLTNSKKLVRSLSRKSVKLIPAKTTRISSNSGSILVEGEGINSTAWISKSGIWAGGVTCLAPQTQQILVGASADVSSKSQLILVNSGLSNSTVDVTVYSESPSFKKAITVKKNQTLNIPLVTLAPGSKAVALQVVPRSGRVAAYLVDERGKGLTALGGDLVNSQNELRKTLYIPAVSHTLNLEKTHVLRVLNSNAISANISVELISADGRYIPVGLDNRSIDPDSVRDISFDVDTKNSVFGLKISSDQPIAASVYSRVKAKNKTDFVWATPVLEGQRGTWAITGLDPVLIVTGSKIEVALEVYLPGGKKVKSKLNASDIAAYKVPQGALGIAVTSIAADNSAALVVSSQSGTGFIPLINGSVLTRSTVPTANIGVLNP